MRKSWIRQGEGHPLLSITTDLCDIADGSKLEVAEGVSAIVVNNGQVAGMYTGGLQEIRNKLHSLWKRVQYQGHSGSSLSVYWVNTDLRYSFRTGSGWFTFTEPRTYQPVRAIVRLVLWIRVCDPVQFVRSVVGWNRKEFYRDIHDIVADIGNMKIRKNLIRQLNENGLQAEFSELGKSLTEDKELQKIYKDIGIELQGVSVDMTIHEQDIEMIQNCMWEETRFHRFAGGNPVIWATTQSGHTGGNMQEMRMMQRMAEEQKPKMHRVGQEGICPRCGNPLLAQERICPVCSYVRKEV